MPQNGPTVGHKKNFPKKMAFSQTSLPLSKKPFAPLKKAFSKKFFSRIFRKKLKYLNKKNFPTHFFAFIIKGQYICQE